jgi:protein-L-isoaspartate(D-aspartate) O-methyltransferase
MTGMIEFAVARRHMVESQLRTNRVTDRRLLAAMGELPRERFLPPSRQPLAYIDADLEVWPAIDGTLPRYLLAPVVLARLIQLASVEATSNVLDIGCATGYSTAVLSRLANAVTAVEVEPELAAAARANLAALGIGNATVVEGPLTEGAPDAAPFDVILVNGSIVDVPEEPLAQLKEGGRLVAVIAASREGRPRQGKAFLFVNVDGEASGVSHFDASAKPLPGFAPTPSFSF